VFSWRRGDHRKVQAEHSSNDNANNPDREADELFRQARDDYLRGNWYEAEETLVALLKRDPNDVDARLMLATLMRHTERYDDARGQLKQLQRLEAAGKWQLEIRREWEYLAREEQTDDDSPEPELSTGETESPEISGSLDEESSSQADVPHAA
jgi:thioredoxin-like negative regulator of GroEL